MKIIKSLLYSLLGKRNYLLLVSRSFIVLYRLGILRISGKFDTHYIAGRLVREGDIVIDVGANMGYYSTIFADKAGRKGRVICVEPVKLYREILERNTRMFENVEILPYALGDYNGVVKMAIPGNDKTRHGLTRVIDDNENHSEILEAEIRKTDELFKDIVTINYIKIDIEGFEDKVLPGFSAIIESNRPVIQVEVDPANKGAIAGLLSDYGYSEYYARKNRLVKVSGTSDHKGDSIYFTSELSSKYKDIIVPKQ